MSDWPAAALGDYVELLLGFAFKSKGFSLNQLGPRLVRGDNVKRGVLELGGSNSLLT